MTKIKNNILFNFIICVTKCFADSEKDLQNNY